AKETPRVLRQGVSLHTKALVLDDARGFVGSFNVDPRSKNLNTEMGVLFEDPAMARRLRDEYLRLTDPALSYRLLLNEEGELRWLDSTQASPVLLESEPDASRWRRALARMSGWLPIESQL
ncbi:MAG: phospholipase D-like domain-containing protein, partial [Pseudoxanthomonas sp.]